MSQFDLEVDKGYEYKGQYYSQRGWNTFIEENGIVEPDNIFDTTNPVMSKNIDDAVKCAIQGNIIAAQHFSVAEEYDKLVNIYLTVLASDFAKSIKLAKGFSTPDMMYTLMRINHPVGPSAKGDNFQIMSNILTMAKVQLELARIYGEWSAAVKKGNLTFTEFCEYAEQWEDATAHETVLTCMTNAYRPKNAALLIDFVDSRSRIFRLVDQMNYEMEVQGATYNPEDISPEVADMFDKAQRLAGMEPGPMDENPDNDDIWKKFIERNNKEGWLNFGGEDLTEPKDKPDDDFNSGLKDEDFA